MEPKQRKLLNNLLISGTALIAFALLDAIKLVISWVVDPIQRFILEIIFTENPIFGWVFVGLIAGLTLLEVIIGCFIGFSARAEAKGRKRNLFYVIVAIIMAAVLLLSSIMTLIGPLLSEFDVFSFIYNLVSAGLSSVVVYSLVDIVICSFKNRKINKETMAANQKFINTNKGDVI